MGLQAVRERRYIGWELQDQVAGSDLARNLVFEDPRYQQRRLYIQGSQLFQAYLGEVSAGIPDTTELNRVLIARVLLAREKRLERGVQKFDSSVNGENKPLFGEGATLEGFVIETSDGPIRVLATRDAEAVLLH